MFCYQRSFGLPTEVVTLEQFRALLSAPETIRKVREAREALARGDKNAYDRKKKGLPLAIFIGTFEESVKSAFKLLSFIHLLTSRIFASTSVRYHHP